MSDSELIMNYFIEYVEKHKFIYHLQGTSLHLLLQFYDTVSCCKWGEFQSVLHKGLMKH